MVQDELFMSEQYGDVLFGTSFVCFLGDIIGEFVIGFRNRLSYRLSRGSLIRIKVIT